MPLPEATMLWAPEPVLVVDPCTTKVYLLSLPYRIFLAATVPLSGREGHQSAKLVLYNKNLSMSSHDGITAVKLRQTGQVRQGGWGRCRKGCTPGRRPRRWK
jgi:hypothetical protein